VDYSDAVNDVIAPIQSTFQLTLSRMASTGEAIGHIDRGEDRGLLVFVPYALAGEQVEIEIVFRRKNFARGRLIRVLQSAPERVTPPCVYYGNCGGCEWQHIDYTTQLKLKTEHVQEQLVRVGKLTAPAVRDCIPSPRVYNYRNHIQMITSDSGRLGFYAEGSHRVIEIEQCLIADEAINTLIAQKHEVDTPMALRVGVNTGERSYIAEPLEDAPLAHVPPIHERIGNYTYTLAAQSFFQVNSHVAALLVDEVMRALDLQGTERVLDLYCGVGLFTLPISDKAKEVIGIESSPVAVKDAQINVRGHENVSVLTADVRLALTHWPRITKAHWDAIVLDPPRAGVEHEALERVAELRAPKIVYVSCDPATLARDIKLLADHGYTLDYAQPLDMFPQTHHVETVAVLTLSSPPV